MMNACSHQWIDPNDPPIARLSYSPVIGSDRHAMKCGTTYRCEDCGEILEIPPSGLPPEAEEAARALGISYETARRAWREIR